MKRPTPIDATIYFAITIFVFLFTGLVFISPFFVGLSNRLLFGVGVIVYNFSTWFCHQLPQRSFSLWGSRFPLDARMTGMFIGGLAGLLSPLFVRYSKSVWPVIIAAILIIPMAVDGISQSILVMRESNNILRFLTGSLAGFGIFSLLPFAVLSAYEYQVRRVFTQTRALKLAVYINVLILIVLFTAGFLVGGSFTSKTEALSLARSSLKAEKFEVIEAYWLAPNSTLSIAWDPYLDNYDDVVLKDIKDLGGLYPFTNWLGLFGRPFTAPHGSWLITALKQRPPQGSRKSVFFPKTPGDYVYIDSFSHRIIERITH